MIVDYQLVCVFCKHFFKCSSVEWLILSQPAARSPKTGYYILYKKEKAVILTFERLEPMSVEHFCLLKTEIVLDLTDQLFRVNPL